jgi:hypothetical protein
MPGEPQRDHEDRHTEEPSAGGENAESGSGEESRDLSDGEGTNGQDDRDQSPEGRPSGDSGDDNGGHDDDDGSEGGDGRRPSFHAIRRAKAQLGELTGHTPEGISALEEQDGRWRLTVDVLELSRIPPSTDVLGTYELEMDRYGNIIEYERTGRYYRSQSLGEES